VTTDVCVYKLQDGRFKDQFGKHSKQQQKTEKDRHVPPFPFKDVVKIGGESFALKSGDNLSLGLFNLET